MSSPTRTAAPAGGQQAPRPTPTPPSPGQTADRPERPSMARAALMVAEREVLAQVRSKSFLISTGLLLVAFLASIVLGAVFSGRDGADTKIAVVPGTAAVVSDLDGIEPVSAADEDEARRLVQDGTVRAAVLPDAGAPLEVRVLALTAAPDELLLGLTLTPEVELLEPEPADEGLRYLVSMGFGLVFLMSATGFGSTIAQNTVQEKQSRIVELLLATVPARALLAGKILGNSALAFAQTAAIAGICVLALVVTGQDDALAAVGTPLVWFILFFVFGFVLLAAIFAASASLVSRMEDVGSVLSPVMMLTMTPYFLVVFFNDNETVLRIMSYVPFSAPVGMPVRLFLGETVWWEPLVSLLVLAVSAVAVVAVGAKVYERSLLRTGARVKLREVLTEA